MRQIREGTEPSLFSCLHFSRKTNIRQVSGKHTFRVMDECYREQDNGISETGVLKGVFCVRLLKN